MELDTNFENVDGMTLRNGSGVTVTIPGPSGIIYRDGARSVTFRLQRTYACDVILTYLIYPPEVPTWEESGDPITPQEFETLKAHISSALTLFNGLTLFIAPKSLKEKQARAKKEGRSDA
jgi:hypothetical protein